MKTLLISISLMALLSPPAWCQDSNAQPVSSEVEIVSAEFGRFPEGKGPRQLPGKEVVFERANKVGKSGYTYGWKIALNTALKSVSVSEKWDENDKMVSSTRYGVIDGLIYHDWDVVMGTRKGKHSVEVSVNGMPVKKFVYYVK